MPLSVIAVIQRNAVVGGTAAAMHRLETETFCCFLPRRLQIEQYVPCRIGKQFSSKKLFAQSP